MIKTIILYFYELNYNDHHIASFISKVVHDLFSFRREVLACTTLLIKWLSNVRRNDFVGKTAE